MMAWIVTVAALLAVSIESEPLLTFSAYPSLRRVTTQVDVGVLPSRKGKTEYWFRKTVQPDNGKIVETLWADTRTCTSGRTALEELVTLEGPRPHVFGLDGRDDILVIGDGVRYTLETAAAPPFHGTLKLQTNTETPLARWVEDTFSKLNGCWTVTPPRRAS